MWVQILSQQWEMIAAYSWGSAVLAWLYRHLCEASCRTATEATLGGCAHLLQVWIWERWPIGRPLRLGNNPDSDDPYDDRLPVSKTPVSFLQ